VKSEDFVKLILKYKAFVFLGLALVLSAGTAAAAVLYGTTLGTKTLVAINTVTNTVTTLTGTPGTPDSLTLVGGCIVYDLSDMSEVHQWCPGPPPTDTTLANSTNGLGGSQDLVLEPGGTTLLVSNYTNGNVTRVNLLGPFPNGTTLTNLPFPEGLAYDTMGHLFINAGSEFATCSAGGGSSKIYQVNPVNGMTITSSSAFDPTNSLDGLLFDPFTGHLWATSKCGGMIYEVDPATLNVLHSYSTGASSYPDGLASNGHGTLYLVLRNDPGPGIPAQIGIFDIPSTTLTPGLTVTGLDDLAQIVSPPTPNTKSFTPPVIPMGTTTTLTITISNPGPQAVTGVAFSDNLPVQVMVNSPPGVVNTCGGTVTATAGSSTVSLANGAIAANMNCTISVTLQGVVLGTGQNNISVSSNEGGQGPNTCPDQNPCPSITVLGPPSIQKSFNPGTFVSGGTSVLTFTLTNPNNTTLTGVTFSDTLPATTPPGLTFTNAPTTNTCGGSVVIDATMKTLTLSNGTIAGPASNTCTITATVTGTNMTATGIMVTNVSGNVTSMNGGTGNTAMAPVTVNPAPVQAVPLTITKSFTPSQINQGQTSVLTFTINNPNATYAASAVTFTDTLPGIIQVANPNGATPTPPCGAGSSVSATPGSNTVALSNGAIPANNSCTFSVTVTGVSGGTATNSVTVSAQINGGPTTSNPGTAQISVVPPPTGTKSFNPSLIPPGGTSTLTFSITNPASSPITLTGVGFTDTLPTHLVVATPNNLNPPAGFYCGTGTVTAVAASATITLAGGTLAPGASCTFSVDVVNSSTVPETLTNCFTVTSNNGPTSSQSCANLNIQSPVPEDAYQVDYIPHLDIGDGTINLTNAGSLGASPFGPKIGTNGYICANVYAFSPDEQEISCCSCLITPNAVVHLSATKDILPNTLTGVKPTSIVVKLLATIPGINGSPGSTLTPPFTQTSCNPAYPFGYDNLTPGLRAWVTKLHALPTSPTSYGITETDFQRGYAANYYLLAQPPVGPPTPLSPGELGKLTGLCQFLIGNGSGAGVCSSCKLGAQ
jgi:uncharacterized repeat protein (TIGR01451 family)